MPSTNTAPEPQWPPRSPHEALLSTPGGRERLRRMAERGSPSPSPTKSRLSRATGALAMRSTNLDLEAPPGEDSLEEEEDEETLQLKLQEIQARLKLKKLQNAKAQRQATSVSEGNKEAVRPGSAPLTAGAGIRSQSRVTESRTARQPERARSQNEVQVPASPVRKAQPPTAVQTSPTRVLLGIDKGLKAKDVSLKRAPSLRKPQNDPGGTHQAGGYLQRTKTPAEERPRPLSFNERLASARTEEVARQERHDKIERLRSHAFNVGRDEMEKYKSEAVELPDIPIQPPTYSREEVLSSLGRPKSGGYLHRSNTAPNVRSGGSQPAAHDPISSEPLQPPSTTPSTATESRKKSSSSETPESEAASFEPYSGLHLSKRILPHQVVTRAVTGKKTYVLKDLLKHVKAPDFSLPDVESDVVVFAIVASKSDPRSHKPTYDKAGKPQPSDRGKYMVITLVDLTWEVELFLFNSGFDRFWKLSTGTVVAILNPAIMPPPPNRVDTGRFSLVVNSDADTILEVGAARDLGYCRSVKTDGQLCSAWVNARRTEHCEFHTNEALRRARTSRIEVSTMGVGGGGGGDGKKNGARGRDFKRSRDGGGDLEKEKHLERARARYDHYDYSTHSRVFVSSSPASLIDREGGGFADRRERAEGLKKRIAARERESELMRQLAEQGVGAGREYMKFGSSVSSSSAAAGAGGEGEGEEPSRKVDARSLGLLAPRGSEQIHLSPVKRKRAGSSQSTATTASTAPGGSANSNRGGLGWGGTLKNKLARMKEGEKLNPAAAAAAAAAAPGMAGNGRDRSPVRKKTRFVTEKGIREAGRESLGAELSSAGGATRRIVTLSDDEDELVIVK
ncbi:Primase zinc finger domain protein [Pleurostoma richardsiae]|uniref:Primase zinc finger domain protein n=1 Tax=Pleurostoma richardsiae TaxID=41990 RepID=A0AA38R497_9PEZI|nr:Primase zinc finger domain protein [Pleurostoma richardsiae]